MDYVEATSSLLDYTKNSRRATASKATRVKSPATNGNTFNAGQQIIFQLPSNVKNTFLDGESLFLRFPFTSTNATVKFEGSCGAYSLINKIEVLTDGQTIVSLDNYAELLSIFADLEAAADAKDNRLAIMHGMNSDRFAGKAVNAGSYTFCLPLHLTMFMSAVHYIPLFSRSSLQIRITLNNANKAVICSGESIENDELSINLPEVCYRQIEVNNEAMQMINENCGGVYSLNVKDFRHIQYTVPASENVANFTHTLGFSMSSLESLYVACISVPSQTNKALPSNSNRQAVFNEFSLLLNGERIPSRQILGRDPAELMTELCIAERSLGTFHYPSSINGEASTFELTSVQATGDASATTGSNVMCVDLESMRPKDEGDMYAGISTIGQNLTAEWNTPGEILESNVHYYSCGTVNLELDMNSAQVWVVSV